MRGKLRRQSRFVPPHQKPLDTTRHKSNLIEDIVVDNPLEGSMGDGDAGVRIYSVRSFLDDLQQAVGSPVIPVEEFSIRED
jgi:hypothetical protein